MALGQLCTVVRAAIVISRRNIYAWAGYMAVFLLGGAVYGVSGFADLWGYYGFTDSYSWSRLVIAGGMLSLLSLITPVYPRLSGVALHLALLLIIVPTLILYAFAAKSPQFLAITLYAYGFFFLAILFFSVRLKTIRVPKVTMGCMAAFLTVTLLADAGSIAYLTGFRFVNLDIWRVYEYRTEIEETLPPVFGYLNSWCG